MAGANPIWVAKQLRHSTMTMLLTTYAKGTEWADKSAERAKIDSLFNAIATESSQKKESMS